VVGGFVGLLGLVGVAELFDLPLPGEVGPGEGILCSEAPHAGLGFLEGLLDGLGTGEAGLREPAEVVHSEDDAWWEGGVGVGCPDAVVLLYL
jgi:hypothetical protein